MAASDVSRTSQAWTGFRGDGSSQSQAAGLPLKWSEAENILWRAELEGFGQSSPVIWGGKVFTTTVVADAEKPLMVTCLALKTGITIWRKRFEASQKIKYTRMIARAAPTPVVDPSGLYLFFGSGDLMKLSHEGDVRWARSLVEEFGEFKGNHGVASSPVRHGDKLILLIANEGPSYVLAADADTGETLWKKDRSETVSWSTPVVTRYKGQDQLIISSNGVLEALDVESGAQLWFTKAIAKNTVASPSIYQDRVIAGSSESAASASVRLGGSGDITDTHMVWQGGSASSFGSPLVQGGRVYFVNRAGVIACLDAKTGTEIWKHRAGDSCWASPVAAGDRLFFFAKNGDTVVMAGNRPEPEVLAVNKLPIGDNDEVYGVAVVDRKILIRTGSALICVMDQGQ